MAYTSPPTFAHGDYPTAANLNILGDDIVALNAKLAAYNYPCPTLDSGASAAFVNIYRWLWYQSYGSDATIVDVAGVEDSYTLPESTGAMAVFDLATVDWLTPGRVYAVEGCRYALEDYAA